jgi:hypothetical protein
MHFKDLTKNMFILQQERQLKKLAVANTWLVHFLMGCVVFITIDQTGQLNQ